PDVTGWIHDPCDAIAPELVLRGKQNLSTPRDGPLDGGVDIFDIHEDHHRGAAVCDWRTTWKARPLPFDHEHRGTDGQQGVYGLSVRTWPLGDDDRVERGDAKIDRRRWIATDQPGD